MRKLVVANFKMNKTYTQTEDYLKEFTPILNDLKIEVGLNVPYTSIKLVADTLKDTNVLVGAQNMNENEKGAFTGEISSEMLVDIGAKSVIVGHSERRTIYREDNNLVNKKILKALKSGLISILCIGESSTERKNNQTEAVLKKQIVEGLKDVYSNELKNIIIAYEPIWAIGTGVVPTDEQIKTTIESIRSVIASVYNEKCAKSLVILYGGSVNDENAKAISKIKGVDGALVGGAALDVKKFEKIILAFNSRIRQ